MSGEHTAAAASPDFDYEDSTSQILITMLRQVKADVSSLRLKIDELSRDVKSVRSNTDLLLNEYRNHNLAIAHLTEVCASKSKFCEVSSDDT